MRETSKHFPVVFAYFLVNPLNAELNPICHLLALLGAYLIFHVSMIRVNSPEAVDCITFLQATNLVVEFGEI
jgi:hypothetical protein